MTTTYYTPGFVLQRLGIDSQTLRNWCREFEFWLEPRAHPESGSHRRFTENDLAVLALVFSLRRDGMKTDEIKAALTNNQRSSLPESRMAIPSTQEKALLTRIENLQARIVELTDEIETLRPDNFKLQARVELLTEQLKALQEENARLNREIGRLTKD